MKSIYLLIFFFLLGLNKLYGQNMGNPDQEYPATMASGTIPIIYINTEDGQKIVDKTTPIPAGFYLDPTISVYDAIGSQESPINLTIRGRGNYTWLQPKKPYKLKFDQKISICGLPKSKHYALLAHIVVSSNVWADNEAAFEMARIIGMPWAPHTVPVELVLNGEYMGVYFLSETVRIEKNRINIFEQEDEETDPDVIPYGWLIELDNTTANLVIRENNYNRLLFTFHSPEILSEQQLDYITNELQLLNAVIYDDNDPDRWIEYFDAKSLAQYFIIKEILHDTDAYSGSFYIYKDKEENAKWHFGPLWDCTIQNPYEKPSYIAHTIIENPKNRICWVSRLMLSPAFEKIVREVWAEFYNMTNITRILDYIENYSKNLDDAFEASNRRWENSGVKLYDRKQTLSVVKSALYYHGKWIDSHLNINEISREFNDLWSYLHPEIKAVSIILNIESTELNVGETIQLEAKILPEDTTEQTIIWNSSDENVAAVSDDGLVTALSAGEAVITAICGEVSTTCVVTVVNPVIEAEQIVLNIEEAELNIEETLQLKATVLPEDTTDKFVTWSSSNEDVASVSEEGLITAVSAGEAVITATCGEVSAECVITVLDDAGVESLLANPNSKISVYSVDGVLIKKDCKAEELKSLAKGIYIIVSGKDRYKISI